MVQSCLQPWVIFLALYFSYLLLQTLHFSLFIAILLSLRFYSPSDQLKWHRKGFDNIQHLTMIKTLWKLSIGKKFFNTIKNVSEKPTANIILRILKAFFLRSCTRQGCLHSLVLQNTVPKVLTRAILEGKKKGIYLNSQMKWFYMQKTSELIKWIQPSCMVQDQHIKLVVFLYASNAWFKKEFQKTIPFTVASKRIEYLFNQRGGRLVHWKL